MTDTNHNPSPESGFIQARRVCELLDTSETTLWRWTRDPDLGFPRPRYVGRTRFWRERDLIGWMEQRPTEAAA